MSEADHYPPVSALGLFFRMGGLVVVIIGVVLVFLSLAGQQEFTLDKRFQAEGRAAMAVVKERYFTQSRDSDGDRKTTYWLELDFVTDRDEDVSVSRTVSRSEFRRVSEGDEIEIRYLESDPDRVEVTEGSHGTASRNLKIVALVVGVVWLAGLWVVGRWVVEALRARKYGGCENAKVIEVVRSNVTINNRPRYRLTWLDANRKEGRSLLCKAEDLSDFGKGDTIRIYQGLKRTWWARDIGDRPR